MSTSNLSEPQLAAPRPAIESAIKALVQAAFLEGGVSLERTAQARAETQARESELIALIGGAPPAAVEPLTDEQAKAVLWAQHLRWMEAAGLDTEGMQPGEWLDHWLFYVRAIEAAHGIGIKKEGRT